MANNEETKPKAANPANRVDFTHKKTTDHAAPAHGSMKQLIIMFTVGVLLQVLLASFFLSIGHAPKPKNVPLGVAGPAPSVDMFEKNLEKDERFAVSTYLSRDEAVSAIRNREIYGALVVTPPTSELLVASASNLQITNLLRANIATAVPGSQVKITDLAPLPPNDANGGSAGFMVQTLIIGGVVGAIAIATALPRTRRVRRGIVAVLAVVLYAILSAEFMIVAASWFGVAVDMDYWKLLFDLSLISAAITGTIVALISLMGFAGLGLAMLTFFLLGNVVSGATLAPELLPEFWRVLGENIPTGAGISLVKNDMYFEGAATSYPLFVLWAYAGIAAFITLFTGGALKPQHSKE